MKPPGATQWPVTVQAAWDGLTATLAGHAGAEALYVPANAVAWSHGLPDQGVITPTEILGATKRVHRGAPETPIVVDLEDGYGGPTNVVRAMSDIGQAGAWAALVNDRCYSTRSPRTGCSPVVDETTALRRVEAAVYARDSCNGPKVVAVTDRLTCSGFDSALVAARSYIAVGADAVGIRSLSAERANHLASVFSPITTVLFGLAAHQLNDSEVAILLPSDDQLRDIATHQTGSPPSARDPVADDSPIGFAASSWPALISARWDDPNQATRGSASS